MQLVFAWKRSEQRIFFELCCVCRWLICAKLGLASLFPVPCWLLYVGHGLVQLHAVRLGDITTARWPNRVLPMSDGHRSSGHGQGTVRLLRLWVVFEYHRGVGV